MQNNSDNLKIKNKYTSRCETHDKHEQTTIHELISKRVLNLITTGKLDTTSSDEFIKFICPEYSTESEAQDDRDGTMIRTLGKISSKEHPILFVDLTGCDYYVEDATKCVQENGIALSGDIYAKAVMDYQQPGLIIILYREYASYEVFMRTLDAKRPGFKKSYKSENNLVYTNMLICEQLSTFKDAREAEGTMHTYKAAFLTRQTKGK